MKSASALSRRTFLHATGLGLGAAAGTLATGVQAAAPLPRNCASHMKLSLAAYSFRDSLAKRGTPDEVAKAEMRISDFIDLCAKLNLDGTELTSYYFPQTVSAAYLMGLKESR